MTRASMVFVGYVLLGSSVARAQEPAQAWDEDAAPTEAPELAQPTSALPTEAPPTPPLVPPLSPIQAEAKYLAGEPLDDAQASETAGSGDGQWVFTSQYGWVFMPYGDQYVDRGEDASVEAPFAFVYGPGNGWEWVAAPWLWGWGTYPYFGTVGPSRLGWYRWLYDGGYGWGGYRGGSRHNVRRIGSTWYVRQGGPQVTPGPHPSSEGGYAQPRHRGVQGGYWGGNALGGYVRGNGLGDAGPRRVAPISNGPGMVDNGQRGGERSPGGHSTTVGPVRSGASAGTSVGSSQNNVSARHGGGAWGLGLRGGGRDDRSQR
jgi:hypothetical protein